MKKKSKVSLSLTVCIIFTAVMFLLSSLVYILPREGVQVDPPKQAIREPTTVPNKPSAPPTPKQVAPVTRKEQQSQAVSTFVANGDTIHFIHIPKCGGTTMTTLLRQIQCTADPVRNADCCLNPGFCDWHAHRRCSTIMGCINHFPNRKLIYKPMPSITVVREPLSRLLSAWFYRGHSPNNDFFQVRPEFKEIRDGKRPKVTFAEYLEMHEYQNIQTRMLGADSFPYRNVTVTDEIFDKAVDALQHIFFIGIQEEFQLSSELLLREIGMAEKLPQPEIKKERDQSNGDIARQKADIKNNAALMKRAREVNKYDLKLYEIALQRFCETAQKYPDLYEKVRASSKVHCALL